jgi:hemolysin activation/secretion protein
MDLFDATIRSEGLPDSQFVAWLGQVQYARRLPGRFGQLILRADAQLAGDELLSLEKIAVGGAGTVRGYRENELVRDNGLVCSVEWRYPLWGEGLAEPCADHLLQIAAFMDYGTAWNKGEDVADEYLHSVGIGLLWTLYNRIRGEFYWAEDLEEAAPKQEYNLQDDGIHFLISVDLL